MEDSMEQLVAAPCVRAAVQAGTDLEIVSDSGVEVLTWRTYELLCKRPGAFRHLSEERTALLHLVVESADSRLLQALLFDHPAGLDANAPLHRETLLHRVVVAKNASPTSRLEMAKVLLAHPTIDVNLQDLRGYTPLMRALLNSAPVARTLAAHPDTDLSLKCETGMSVLDIARLVPEAGALRVLRLDEDDPA